jgi:hypothetical protein
VKALWAVMAEEVCKSQHTLVHRRETHAKEIATKHKEATTELEKYAKGDFDGKGGDWHQHLPVQDLSIAELLDCYKGGLKKLPVATFMKLINECTTAQNDLEAYNTFWKEGIDVPELKAVLVQANKTKFVALVFKVVLELSRSPKEVERARNKIRAEVNQYNNTMAGLVGSSEGPQAQLWKHASMPPALEQTCTDILAMRKDIF